jgi:site-specific recombinase XerD
MKHIDPLFDTVEAFFTDHLKRISGCSQRTLESYRDALRLLFEYASKMKKVTVDQLKLSDFDVELIKGFLQYLEDDRHNRVSTRNCRLAALHSFFAFALERHPEQAGHLATIVALEPKRHSEAPPRYIDASSVQMLLRDPDRNTQEGRRDYALMLFLFNTGARVSEAIGVRYKDLLPGPAVELHGKGNKTRVSPLWPETIAAIKAQLLSTDLDRAIFESVRAHALSRHGVYHILVRHAAAAHKRDSSMPSNVFPHLLRHSCAVAMLQAGADLVTIRDQLGHVSITTTGRYAIANLNLKRAALEAFWKITGLSTPKTNRWRPTKELMAFLHSI